MRLQRRQRALRVWMLAYVPEEWHLYQDVARAVHCERDAGGGVLRQTFVKVIFHSQRQVYVYALRRYSPLQVGYDAAQASHTHALGHVFAVGRGDD